MTFKAQAIPGPVGQSKGYPRPISGPVGPTSIAYKIKAKIYDLHCLYNTRVCDQLVTLQVLN